jgi:site-specific recombinase XerD
LQAEGHSRNTINPRVRRVQLFTERLDGRQPDEATTADVVGYMASLDVEPQTRATYYAHLRAWFDWLVKSGHRDDNPMDRMKAPRVPRAEPRPVSPAELERILSVRVRKRTRMMILLAALQGLRCIEIAKTRGEDVNLADGIIFVVGKGGVRATLQLHPLVAELAAEFPRRGYWFPTYKGNAAGESGPILPRSVSHIVSEVFQRAGVSGGAHRLRHWHATELIQGGTDVRVVQTLLRHASLSTTARYTQVDSGQQRAAIDRLVLPGMKPQPAPPDAAPA